MKPVTIYFDGASKGNPGHAGIGGVVTDETGNRLEVKKYIGTATNNQAEYTALLETLQAAKKTGATHVDVYSDSELVVKQLNGEYRIKDEKLRVLFDQVIALCRSFQKIKFTHVPREKNKRADALANEAVYEAVGGEKSEWIHVRLSSFKSGALLASYLGQILERESLASPGDVLSVLDKLARRSPSGKGSLSIKLHKEGKGLQLDWDCEKV